MQHPGDIKVVIVASGQIDSKSRIVSETRSQLLKLGYSNEDIEFFQVPSDMDLVYGCSFIFDHLLVDGAIAISSDYDIMIADKLIHLQLECDFPIEYRWDEMELPERSGITEMVDMMDAVLAKADGDGYSNVFEQEYVPETDKKKSIKVN